VSRLDLSVPLDRAIASELYELALRQEGENWIGETIDGRSFSAPEDYDNPWVIPSRGILELRYFSTPLPPSLDDVVSADHMQQIISHVSSQAGSDNSNTVSNDKAGRDLLLSHSKEHVFNCNQVRGVFPSAPPAPSPPAPPGACPPQDNLDADGARIARYRHVKRARSVLALQVAAHAIPSVGIILNGASPLFNLFQSS
jgi:hypothetical protein